MLKLVCVALLAAAVAAKKALVLVDHAGIQSSHSQFIHSLLDAGFDVTVKLSSDDSIEIKKYGQFLYDSLVLLCPETKDFGGSLDDTALLDFVDGGNSLIIAGSLKVSRTIREIAAECGVEFADKGTFVMDHFNYDASDPDGLHSLIIADGFAPSAILSGRKFQPVLYHGIALSVSESNPLVTKLLVGSPTAYGANPIDPITSRPSFAGTTAVLVAAVQTLNSGRVLVTGSMDMLSDKALSAAITRNSADGGVKSEGLSGNAQFLERAVSWTLGQRGLLRAHSLFHRKADGSEVMPKMYRVNDDLVFTIVIEEYDGTTDSWKPFQASDVQLEWRMIDPYVRTFLVPSGNGTFVAEFKVPDRYGVFKFVIDYRRDGYSHIDIEHEVGVRPFKHNEFERFIPSAFPYYVSAASMMGGFLVFSVIFLFTKETDKKEKKQ